jgi:energy-coupling factor transporter transmembrane protein EcfT
MERPISTSLLPTIGFAFPFILIAIVFLLLFFPGVILTIFAWITLRNMEIGKYAQARTSSLILGIVGLFFGLIIGGIFFLLAYANLGEYMTPLMAVQPLPQRFCVNCGRAMAPNTKYCAYCGKELPP